MKINQINFEMPFVSVTYKKKISAEINHVKKNQIIIFLGNNFQFNQDVEI